jgi:archaeal flagellar protein FlaJ
MIFKESSEGNMKFKIPFTAGEIESLKKKSKFFISKIKPKKKTHLEQELKDSGLSMTREDYLGICLRTFIFSFILICAISATVLVFLRVPSFYLFSIGLALMFSGFIFFSQMVYPMIYIGHRQKNIERNLISALDDILIQINSGIPLFTVMVNISASDYGELSEEFRRIVRRINSGEPEADVLDDVGRKNPSLYFRRTLWQISNGMKSGGDMTAVIRDSIKNLHEEQIIQIQAYGNKLNPLVVFYMLIAMIIPSLSISFLTILSSMLNMDKDTTMMVFIGMFIMVFLMQIMFIGLIKSRRPTLM